MQIARTRSRLRDWDLGASDCQFLDLSFDRDELEQIVLDFDPDRAVGGKPALQKSFGQRILDQILDDTSQRSGSIGVVVSAFAEQVHSLHRNFERDVLLGQLLANPLQFQLDDLADLLLRSASGRRWSHRCG